MSFKTKLLLAAILIGTCCPALAQMGAIYTGLSTLTLPSGITTAYNAGQLIANSATANLISVPSVTLPAVPGGFFIPRLRLDTNDSTSASWAAVTIQVDLWSLAPTFNNGDRGTWSVKTGSNNHIASFTCTMSAEQSDGAFSECYPTVGTVVLISSPTTIYWTLEAISASGTTGPNGIFTLRPEALN